MCRPGTITCLLLRSSLVCYIYFVLFAIVLPSICKNWPYSKYFAVDENDKEIVRQLIAENDKRIEFAEELLDRDRFRTLDDSDGKQLDLVIVVITVNRESKSTGKLQFLTQTVAHLMLLLKTDTSKLFKNKHVVVCNVDDKGLQFPEAMSLSNIVQVVSKFSNTSASEDEEIVEIFEKEKIDYIYCLQQAKMHDPHFVLMIEDDVILETTSLRTVDHLMNLRLTHTDHNTLEPDAWLFVKLYYPEKWQGYGFEVDKIGELVGIAILGGTVFVFIALIYYRLTDRLRGASRISLFLMFWLGAGTLVVTLYLIGRPYVQVWRHASPYTHRLVQAPGCCTQAILYPSAIIDNLVRHLSETRCTINFSVDLAIDAFAAKRNLKSYLVEPNLCQHIGFISSLRSSAKKAAEFLT